jgi:hypothetical protein
VPMPSKWSLSITLPYQSPACTSPLLHMQKVWVHFVCLTVPCTVSIFLPLVPAIIVKSVTALVTREYDDAPLRTASSNSFDRNTDGNIVLKCILQTYGQDNTVSTVTHYGLDGPGIKPQ